MNLGLTFCHEDKKMGEFLMGRQENGVSFGQEISKLCATFSQTFGRPAPGLGDPFTPPPNLRFVNTIYYLNYRHF